MGQINLLSSVMNIYLHADEPISNNELYRQLNHHAETNLFLDKKIVGKAKIDTLKRKIRWYQQTLKQTGVLERVPNKRGFWQLNPDKNNDLTQINEQYALLGFSTELGVAIIADCKHFFNLCDDPIHLILTSPPYPLQKPRKYGNVTEAHYVDWLCSTLEPVIKNMVDGGSLCLNISNDIFMSKLPARSLYRERLVLALCDRFGLYKCDELIWENASKPPGPIAWASKKRVQLNVSYEPIYWFTNNPEKLRSNNQRVLLPHTVEHLKLIAKGGIKKEAVCSDGAYVKKIGSYSNITEGKIPRNILKFGHASKEVQAYKQFCIRNNLPVHGAMMPLKLVKFLIEFLTEPNDLVADPFSGALTTALAAENTGRRWVAIEKVKEYVEGAQFRFDLFNSKNNKL